MIQICTFCAGTHGGEKLFNKKEGTKEPLLKSDGTPLYSKTYRTVWLIYWAGTAIFLLINGKTVIGTSDYEKTRGGVELALLFAAILLSSFLSCVVLRRRRRFDTRGREITAGIRWYHFLLMAAVDVYAFLLIESINNEGFLQEMKYYYMLLNIAGIFIIHMIMFFWLNSWRRSCTFVVVFWTVMSIVFYAVYQLRGEPFQLIDVFSLGTALSVAGHYTLPLTRAIISGVVLTLCLIGILMNSNDYTLARKLFGRILMRVGVFVFMIFGYFFYVNVNWNGGLGILTDLFNAQNTYSEYGTTVGFFCVAKYMRVTPPEGYSASETEKIAEEAAEEEDKETNSTVKPVNIIAIMNESWADYRYVGDLETNEDVMPYYDSMEENTIKGHTMVCITGGGTAKTEYEFLTGNSEKRFPAMVPYVSYFTHDQYSLVSTLEAQGYETAAMHPNKGSVWNRSTAYSRLGFDTFYTIDDFDEDADTLRGYVTDQANYEKIIEVIENKESDDQPFFLFDVTIQNHGGYTQSSYTGDITVNGYTNDVVNRFLSLERESDDALRYLIEYFKKCDQPTLIVMFGDHYPHMPDSFTEYISGSKYDDLDASEKVKYYETPFFIWANYDIPEQDNVITSTNYLGTLMLGQTGLEMADYNYYLKDLMEIMPGLNHMGYYDKNYNFHTWSSGSDECLQAEWEYECLQYNNLVETRKRLDWFFGLD